MEGCRKRRKRRGTMENRLGERSDARRERAGQGKERFPQSKMGRKWGSGQGVVMGRLETRFDISWR